MACPGAFINIPASTSNELEAFLAQLHLRQRAVQTWKCIQDDLQLGYYIFNLDPSAGFPDFLGVITPDLCFMTITVATQLEKQAWNAALLQFPSAGQFCTTALRGLLPPSGFAIEKLGIPITRELEGWMCIQALVGDILYEVDGTPIQYQFVRDSNQSLVNRVVLGPAVETDTLIDYNQRLENLPRQDVVAQCGSGVPSVPWAGADANLPRSSVALLKKLQRCLNPSNSIDSRSGWVLLPVTASVQNPRSILVQFVTRPGGSDAAIAFSPTADHVARWQNLVALAACECDAGGVSKCGLPNTLCAAGGGCPPPTPPGPGLERFLNVWSAVGGAVGLGLSAALSQ